MVHSTAMTEGYLPEGDIRRACATFIVKAIESCIAANGGKVSRNVWIAYTMCSSKFQTKIPPKYKSYTKLDFLLPVRTTLLLHPVHLARTKALRRFIVHMP